MLAKGVWVNASVSDLVEFAYHVAPWRAVFPVNMPGGGFALMETLAPGHNGPALQREIKKQFGLMGHSEMRKADALRLVVNHPARSLRNQLDQLGLEIVPTNMPVQMLVVEKAK